MAGLNFSWITDTLAVGGSFPIEVAPALAADHGIRVVVDLREEACDDAEALNACGIAFLHLPTEDHCAVSQDKLDLGVEFVREAMHAGAPVLIHCEHGIGRSATLALCVLAAEGWEPMAALRRAKDRRALVSPSVAQYHAFAEWLERHGGSIPHFDAFKAVAYRHLSHA